MDVSNQKLMAKIKEIRGWLKYYQDKHDRNERKHKEAKPGRSKSYWRHRKRESKQSVFVIRLILMGNGSRMARMLERKEAQEAQEDKDEVD
jgi:hypothetical protein